MKAEVAQQRSLLELSELDAEMSRITHRANRLPQREAIERMRGEHDAANDRLGAVRIALQDLDVQVSRYESEIELALVQEYRAVLPLFAYVVETERRFYLANKVDVAVRSDTTPACVELELRDAWVWDMYRPARFVPSVRVVTFRDVNIERLPEQEL